MTQIDEIAQVVTVDNQLDLIMLQKVLTDIINRIEIIEAQLSNNKDDGK